MAERLGVKILSFCPAAKKKRDAFPRFFFAIAGQKNGGFCGEERGAVKKRWNLARSLKHTQTPPFFATQKATLAHGCAQKIAQGLCG